MSPLFAKILAWFLAALLITVLATALTSIVSYKQNARLRAPFSLMIALGGTDARHAWETGGRPALRESLERFLRVTQAYGAAFTDAEGTDLLTGEAEADLIESARRHAFFPSWRRHALVFSRFAPDQKYCFFLMMSPVLLVTSSFQPAHLGVVAVVAALCYGLTFYLMAPLRSLRRAVERFGRGDLSARAPDERRDELGELARTFNQMAGRLQSLLAAQHRLLLDISHELRSPLTRLSVAVELARSGEASELPLNRIQKEADRLNELIGQMLEVARAETDPAYRRMEAVRLDQLIGELVEDCSIEAQVRGCELALEHGAAVWIEGDRELLRRAIENVMRNAIRYAPEKSRVEICLENGAARARVKVRDYGPGVPEADLTRIFDPFYRVGMDRDRASGGVGLGLAIARRAVEIHQGNLRASNAQPGLLVEIELPV